MLDHLRQVAEGPDLAGTRYDVEGELGRGGMGVVYRARDRLLGRSIALKVINDGSEISEGEARIIAQLEHPGIVPLYDAGSLPDGRGYYAMKLVEGASLDEFLARESTLAERLRIFERVCEAVAFAHSRGVVHRDLKPQNVMIGEFGEVLVMDWGVARRLEDSEPAGTVVGTPRYMAPEHDSGPPCDVYALGALLDDLMLDQHPRALVAIAAKARAAVPESRYPSATELAADVSRFLDGNAVTAYDETTLDRAIRFARRNSTLLLLIAAYLLVRAIFFALR